MSELNKKLAEFVWGEDKVKLLWGHTNECGYFSLVPPGYKKQKFDTEQCLCFLHPEKPYWQVVPDFEYDPTACFKWLESELYRRGLRYQLTRLQDGHKAIIFALGKAWAEVVAYASDEKPATAFCKAVEQLMDAEARDETEILRELKRVSEIERKEKQ